VHCSVSQVPVPPSPTVPSPPPTVPSPIPEVPSPSPVVVPSPPPVVVPSPPPVVPSPPPAVPSPSPAVPSPPPVVPSPSPAVPSPPPAVPSPPPGVETCGQPAWQCPEGTKVNSGNASYAPPSNAACCLVSALCIGRVLLHTHASQLLVMLPLSTARIAACNLLHIQRTYQAGNSCFTHLTTECVRMAQPADPTALGDEQANQSMHKHRCSTA
jgi:hypothetical protein